MKYTKRFLCVFSFLLVTTPLHISEIKAEENSDFDFSFFGEDQTDDCLAEINPQLAHHTSRFPKDVTLSTLTSLNIQNVLKTELYQRTHAPIRRNPIDLPILQILSLSYDDQKTLMVTPFISTIWKQNYTDTSSSIDSYINLKLQDVMEVLDANEFTTISMPEVLELFTPLKMQEHTAGFMFQGIATSDRMAYTFSTPIYYTLDNFYLTADEQTRISNYPLFSQFNGDIIDFARHHLTSDRLGLGDTLLTAEYLLRETYSSSQSIGATLTVPTAFAFKKGLFGHHFNLNAKPHALDLYSDLIDPYLEDVANGSNANTATIQENAELFGLSALDRLSTMLLERNMGNNYHWALGTIYRSTIHFNDYISLISKMNFEVKTPSVCKRFFLVEATEADFNQFDWEDNAIQVNEKIDFLNMQFKNVTFPIMYYATVFPGVLFHSTSCLKRHMAPGRWEPSIGFDSWFHSAEHFLNIKAPDYQLARINKDKARRTRAWSSSVWIGIDKVALPPSNWSFYWKGYVSMLNAGFGDSYGLSFTFEKTF